MSNNFCKSAVLYSDAQADVMISSIDVYLLTLSAFLSMIVAVVVAM